MSLLFQLSVVCYCHILFSFQGSFPLIKLLMEPCASLLCDITNTVDIFIGMEISSLQVIIY
jgi:hypothetical protein